MKQIFSPSHRLSGVAAWAIVLLTLGQLGWLQSQPGSELRELQAKATQPSARKVYTAPYENIDQMAARCAPGNVFLKLTGPASTNHESFLVRSFSDYQDYSISTWYFRMTYDLYPRRCLVAPSDVVINGDLMSHIFIPSPVWLQDHGVHSVVTVGFDEHGRTLPARLDSWSASAPGGGP